MTGRVSASIVGAERGPVWGLGSHERLRRQLAQLGITHLAAAGETPPADATVLVLDAGYVFETRTISALLAAERALLECPRDGRIAAAVGAAGDAAAIAATMLQGAEPTLPVLGPPALAGYSRNLRKSEPPMVEPIDPHDPAQVERLLYDAAYKGVTDLVTKWLWPRPARFVTGWCARRGITPNSVTLAGLVLVVAATLLFAGGWFAPGLACAWLMTFLDTVDGKLARVTVTTSRFGHYLDHGIDWIHPPFWYVCWGAGLVTGTEIGGIALDTLAIAVVAGYVGGRLVELLFHQLGHCGMFAWRPLDAWFRLVAARRNPCLVLLTGGYVIGRADWGYLAVVAWTVACTVLLALRFLVALRARSIGGPLDSWLGDAATAAQRWPRSFAVFSATRTR